MKTHAAPDLGTLLEILAEEVRSIQAVDTLAPIEIIAPSDLARSTVRRSLARELGGMAAVSCLTLEEWVRRRTAASLAERGARRIGNVTLQRLVGVLLGRVAVASPALRTPGAVGFVASTVQDLMQAQVSPAALAQATFAQADALRQDLTRIYEEVLRELTRRRFVIPVQEEALAAESIESGAKHLPRVHIWIGFHDLTSQQRSLVDRLDAAIEMKLFIPGPGGAGEAAAASLVEWAKQRGPCTFHEGRATLLTLEEPLFAPTAKIRTLDPERVELLTCATDAAEIRAVLRRIRRRVREGEASFDDFALVIGAQGPSPRLVRRQFARAAVPLEDRVGVSGSETLEGKRALLLVRTAHSHRPVQSERALEFATRKAEPPTTTNDVFAEPRTNFLRARDAREAANALRHWYESIWGALQGECVEEALFAVEEVYEDSPLRLRDFAREFTAALTSTRDRPAASRGEASVLFVRLDQARAISRPAIYYCGCVAGGWTSVPKNDPLLPDTMREAWNERAEHRGSRLPLKSQNDEESLLLLRFALQAAEREAGFFTSSRAHQGSGVRLPAGPLVDFATSLAGPETSRSNASPFAWFPRETERDRIDEPVDRFELELALFTSGPPQQIDDFARLYAEGGGVFLEEATECLRERWAPSRLSRFDGVLTDPNAIQAVVESRLAASPAWGATSLETLVGCPFAFLVTGVLGLSPPRETEDDYDALERGSLVHEFLEVVYSILLEEQLLPLTPAHLGRAFHILESVIRRERDNIAGLPRKARILRQATLDLLHRELSVHLVRESHEPLTTRGTPSAFEVRFSPSKETPCAYPISGGRSVPLRGKIDRIDSFPDESLEIIDYKTGQLPRIAVGTRIEDKRTVVHLQLPLYVHVAAQLYGREIRQARFLSTRDSTLRSSSTPSQTVLEQSAFSEAFETTKQHLELGLRCFEEGWFPSLPGEGCCRPELAAICGASIAARFRRKRTDARLAQFLAEREKASAKSSKNVIGEAEATDE